MRPLAEGLMGLNSASGSVKVAIDWGTTCTKCGNKMEPGTIAVLVWAKGEPTELRHDGECPLPSPSFQAPPVTGYKETSRQAYEAALPKLNATQKVILELYQTHGPMTDEELYDRYGALDPAAYRNTVLPARTGLNKLGLVFDTRGRKPVKSGRTAIVWGCT